MVGRIPLYCGNAPLWLEFAKETCQPFADDWDLAWRILSITLLACEMSVLEKETATHSSVLAWRIPGTGEPGGLHSPVCGVA